MDDDYIVEMKHITKRFPGIVANDDVTIQVKKGEIYALLGENGAGKSTLMSMLFGMYEPDEGEIYIRGEKVTLRSSNDAAALKIGMVHQHFKLISNYTIAENIIMGVEPMKRAFGILPYVDIKTANERIRKLSVQYGLEVDPEKRIDEVTVSIQQRVEILKMLYRDAEILIFDEPTSILTPQEIEYLLEIMRQLAASGKTIILITHKLDEIKKVADRCAILRQGKLIGVLNVADASTKELADMMVGRDVQMTRVKDAPSFGDDVLNVKDLVVENEHHFPLVKGISFHIRAGEIFAVAGVSGNGQEELADAIAGLVPAASGSITLNGKDITHATVRERTDLGMTYIPEDRQGVGMIMDLSLRDNLALRSYYKEPFDNKGFLNYGEFNSYANKLISEYDIRSGQGGKTIVRSMSGGNQQKAIVAREIAQGAPFMIFVQPTRGLDIGAIENIRTQILEERKKGRAILLISLELDEVMELADTIGVIYNGELLKIADASTLSKNEVGSYMMGVKDA